MKDNSQLVLLLRFSKANCFGLMRRNKAKTPNILCPLATLLPASSNPPISPIINHHGLFTQTRSVRLVSPGNLAQNKTCQCSTNQPPYSSINRPHRRIMQTRSGTMMMHLQMQINGRPGRGGGVAWRRGAGDVPTTPNRARFHFDLSLSVLLRTFSVADVRATECVNFYCINACDCVCVCVG